MDLRHQLKALGTLNTQDVQPRGGSSVRLWKLKEPREAAEGGHANAKLMQNVSRARAQAQRRCDEDGKGPMLHTHSLDNTLQKKKAQRKAENTHPY